MLHLNLIIKGNYVIFPSSQSEGAHLSDHDQLGSGVSHPGPTARSQDVQPVKAAVRLHWGAAPCHEEDVHHQRGLSPRHHQPPGLPRSDQISAVCSHGKGGGEAHD